MTTNGGQSWKVISPDLTTNDKSRQGNSGGISSDNLTTFDGATLYALAESPVKAGVIWTGSTDGQVNVTQDAGGKWTNVTKNMPNLPPWGTVWSIAPSHFDAGTAYVVENLQHEGIYDALVYKTTDYGATFKLISSSVPKGVNSSAHIIVEDPVRKGMLYLGTDNALYISWDDGGNWTRLRNDLPPAPVYWMQVQPTFNDLVIGTHGRGVYILDDVTPLRSWDTAQSQDFHLFDPRPTYRFRGTNDGRESEPDAHVQGESAQYGADINFALKSVTPEVQISISITGPNNATIRTLNVAGHPGLNRVWWDLRYDGGSTITMQTPPLFEPWAPARRQYAAYGTRIPPAAPVVPPGGYTVHVKVGSNEQTAKLTVLADPNSPGTPQTIEAQVAFLREVLAEIDQVAQMGNALESMRKQAQDLKDTLAKDPQKSLVMESVMTFEAGMSKVEAKMIDLRNTGRSEDAFRQPVQLYERISWMIGQMGGNGGSGGGDLGPTDQQVEVNNGFKQELAAIAAEYKQITDKDLPAMNALLKQNGITVVIKPQ
jgi:hypothetical protein